MDTAMRKVLRRSDSVPEQARIGSKGLRGSQEYRWVTTGPGARLEMEKWLHHLDADTLSIAPFQLKWDQQQLVLSHSGLKWPAEVSNGGAHARGKVGGPAPVQLRHGIERSEARGRLSGGGQGQTRIEPSASAIRGQGDDKRVRIVTLTVPTLSLVDALLTESQKWDSETLFNRQILMDEGAVSGHGYDDSMGAILLCARACAGSQVRTSRMCAQATTCHSGQSRWRWKATATPKETKGFLRRLLAACVPSPRKTRSPRHELPLQRRSVQKKQEN
jgi:hypothetical protein